MYIYIKLNVAVIQSKVTTKHRPGNPDVKRLSLEDETMCKTW